MNRIINGDCLKTLPMLSKARMIFADPPDNLGVKYDGFEDKWETTAAYIDWLYLVSRTALRSSFIFWLSYYWKWDFPLKGELAHGGVATGWCVKPYVWWYTFGQHQQKDNGSCFRPMLRFSKPGTVWNTDDVREPSARLREYGDSRADLRGRVPGDVWDGVWQESRVCGSFKEKRKWHRNQHPEALIKRMVLMSTKPGDLIIDMFAGSGTVNRVCKELGRDCIGIEISKTYCDRIREELEND